MKPAKLEVNMNGVAEVELIYRTSVPAGDRLKVKNTETAYKVFLDNWNREHLGLLEEFKVMFLNCKCGVLGVFSAFRGGITSTHVDPRLIYVAALRTAATSIIVAHNHPSGDVNPSRDDKVLTERLANGCKTLEIKLLDHLIITPERYFSFADAGIRFFG